MFDDALAASHDDWLAPRLSGSTRRSDLGRIDVLNSAPKCSHASVEVRGPAPKLGEHSESVLRELLGYDDDRMATLQAGGVLRFEEV